MLREKLRVTIISAALTALGGAIYGQYFMNLNPDTVSGIAILDRRGPGSWRSRPRLRSSAAPSPVRRRPGREDGLDRAG